MPNGIDVDTGGKAHSRLQQRVPELQYICSYVSICHIYLPYLSVTLQKCTWYNDFHLEHVNLLKFVPMTEVTKLNLLVTDHNNFKIISERNPTMDEKKLSGLFGYYLQEMQH